MSGLDLTALPDQGSDFIVYSPTNGRAQLGVHMNGPVAEPRLMRWCCGRWWYTMNTTNLVCPVCSTPLPCLAATQKQLVPVMVRAFLEEVTDPLRALIFFPLIEERWHELSDAYGPLIRQNGGVAIWQKWVAEWTARLSADLEAVVDSDA